MVPHLVTALTGPINELEQRLLDTMPAIERWFRLEWMEHTPAFYAAVDIRNAGFKLSPVETDLFPSAWQNLTEPMLPLAVQAAMAAVEKICPEARNLLIIPESKDRSTAYLNNLAQLRRVFRMAGLNVRIGSISPDIKKATTMELPGGQTITLEPVLRNKGRLGVRDFDPCTILLNTGLETGVPGILEDIHQQYLLPPLHASWSTRRKSVHSKCLDELAKRFGKLVGVDSWLIHPMMDGGGELDLDSAAGREDMLHRVDQMLTKTRKKYKEYGIKEKAFAVVKSDNRSVGLGPLTVRDTRDLEALLADKTAVARAGLRGVHELVVQEGVQTRERMNDAVAEPVVYLMDRYVVGGFYRVHASASAQEMLSVPGSSFVPLAFAESNQLPQPGVRPGASAPNRFYMYGVVARLAMLASSYELEATDPDAEHYD